jgi:hypothetical protein
LDTPKGSAAPRGRLCDFFGFRDFGRSYFWWAIHQGFRAPKPRVFRETLQAPEGGRGASKSLEELNRRTSWEVTHPLPGGTPPPGTAHFAPRGVFPGARGTFEKTGSPGHRAHRCSILIRGLRLPGARGLCPRKGPSITVGLQNLRGTARGSKMTPKNGSPGPSRRWARGAGGGRGTRLPACANRRLKSG